MLLTRATGTAVRLSVGILVWALGMPLMAATPSISNLYTFTGEPAGAFPEGSLVAARNGALYGTTTAGGTYGWGTVYALLPPSGTVTTWTQKTIYNFKGALDGANPTGNLIQGSNQVLYGTCYQGGNKGFGTIFSLTPMVGGTWTEQTLYAFKGGTDGAFPQAGLIQSSTSLVIYGTTLYGGTTGNGTVFSLTPMPGNVWSEKVLYSFQGGTDGANPESTLTLAAASKLYGTTAGGGASDAGTVFQLTISGGVATETVIYSFTGLGDGGSPEGAVSVGPQGVLYGTTFYGGNAGCTLGGFPAGCGGIFQLTPPTSGGAWTYSDIYTFTGTGMDGAHPYGNLAVTGHGVIYGATLAGGSSINVCFPASFLGCGTLYKFQNTAGSWMGGTLVYFNGDDGGGPNGVTVNTAGSVFGSTSMGGVQGGFGTVFQLVP